MKKSKVVLSLTTGLLVAVLAIVALMPSILSSDTMKPFVIRKVNAQLPGQLQLESWSVRWFGGIEGRGIVYDSHTDGFRAQMTEIRIERGLLRLIVARGNLGAIEIVDPTVVFALSDAIETRGQQKATPSGPPPEPVPFARKDAFLPAFYGKLIITNGSLVTAATGGNEKRVAQNLNLLLDAPGPDTPLTYRFSAESGDGSGRASGDGSLVLAADDPLAFQKIQSDSKLSVENWELDDIFAIIASRANIPSAKGRLNAWLSLKGSSSASLKMAGHMAMKSLRLRGGQLGTDTPTVKDIAIDLEGSSTGGTFSIDKLTLASSLANGSASGIVGTEDQMRFSGIADIDLAEVSAQVPATLNLREDTKITKGKMALTATIETARAGTAFDGDARIDRLQGISAGKPISWTEPVTLNARGQMRREGLQLENLALRSSFLKADGRGDLRNMRVDLAADLRAALAELRKFIDMKELDGSGKLELHLALNAKAGNLSQAALNLSVDDFELSRGRRPILARQAIRADLHTDVQVAEAAVNGKLLQPSLKIQSSLASGTVAARQITGSASNPFPDATELKLDGTVNLQQLSALLKNLSIIAPQTELAGQSKIEARGALTEGRLALDSALIDTREFTYRQDNKTIRENRIILTTRGQVGLNNRTLLLAPVEIDSQAGKIHIPKLTLADWASAQKNLKVNGQADLDLDRLAQGYGDFIQLPEKTQISGTGRFDFDMDFADPKTQYIKLQGNVTPFKLVSKSLPTISENKITLDADVNRSPDGRNLTINNLELNSNALWLSAAGTLNQVGSNKVLDAKGTMKPDMALVSDYLKKTGQSQVAFTGKQATPFTIKMVSKGDRWEEPLKHLDFSGAVHVTAIEAYGLKLSPGDVPVRVAGAAAGAKLESPANGGHLYFQPTVDMRQDPYVLSFKENADLLRDVQITQGVIDGLLSAIHPLFKDAVVPDGLLGLNLRHFSWPLAEKQRNRATFAGTLKLNGVRLNSTPFMAGLLNMMGVSERQLSLADQEIAFEAKDGRIGLSPVTLEAEGYPVMMQGSIGFDSTLDFIARLPVTEKMVGKDAYQFLQGTTIKVPIRGTASKPSIDQTAFQQATGDLMQQALRKNLEKGAQDLLKNLLKK